jgi:hypothetical protein
MEATHQRFLDLVVPRVSSSVYSGALRSGRKRSKSLVVAVAGYTAELVGSTTRPRAALQRRVVRPTLAQRPRHHFDRHHRLRSRAARRAAGPRHPDRPQLALLVRPAPEEMAKLNNQEEYILARSLVEVPIHVVAP